MSGTEIIIGIDFGTTYSGVSWALSAGAKDVRIINDWPNPQGILANQDKVPSAIAYNNAGKVSKWGFKVGPSDVESFTWMKIMLDPSHKYFDTAPRVKEMLDRLGRLRKTAEDVVTDYLTCLWEYTLDHLERKKGDDFRELYTLKVVLTVPAVWSPLAKDKTLRAAKRAGMPVSSQLVTEPEAAALAVLKQKSEENTISVGDSFIVCDAGGGTVDLISYKVEGLYPLKVRECFVGDGGLCGSVFLDTAFEQHIRTVVGRHIYDKIAQREKRRMFRDFEFGIKRSFTQVDTSPLSVDLKGVGDNPDIGIFDDETIQIKPNTLRAIFDSICEKIQALVEKQLQGIKRKGLRVKAILLVGGFGESKYLCNYLRTANIRDNVKVLQELGAISAVCRGATLWGLEQNHATSFISRISRISYGIVLSMPFDSSIHNTSEKIWDEAKSKWMAKGQMKWLLKRGEEVVEGRVLEGGCYVSLNISPSDCGNKDLSSSLFYSNADTPPQRRSDPSVKMLCTVPYSIPYSELRKEPTYYNAGKYFRDIHHSQDIIPGGATLAFRLVYKGRIRSVDAKYVESF